MCSLQALSPLLPVLLHSTCRTITLSPPAHDRAIQLLVISSVGVGTYGWWVPPSHHPQVWHSHRPCAQRAAARAARSGMPNQFNANTRTGLNNITSTRLSSLNGAQRLARTKSTGNSLASNVRRAAATAWGLMSCGRSGKAQQAAAVFSGFAEDMSARLSAKSPKNATRATRGPWQCRRGRASSWPDRLLSSPTRIQLP